MKSPKILLFGKSGQVGWELQRSLSMVGKVVAYDHDDVDVVDLASLSKCIQNQMPDFIVNATAYTAVDKAEFEPEKAKLINAAAVKVMAEEALKLNSWFVHYSTDYVFDGEKSSSYIESDIGAPLSVYGQTKFDGENAILASGCKHLILRSSWVYSIRGTNFPTTILKRALESERLDVVSDVFGSPTGADLIADVTALVMYRLMCDEVLAKKASGIYHLVASGQTSWYEYAKFLVSTAKKQGIPLKLSSNKIFPLTADGFKALAKRPKNCRLDNKKITDTFSLNLPDWKVHVTRFVNELVR